MEGYTIKIKMEYESDKKKNFSFGGTKKRGLKFMTTSMKLSLIIILYIILVLISMKQPFQGDEVLFSVCAENYVNSGKPYLNQSQFSNPIIYPELDKEYKFSSFHSSCLGHPPLYINLLAAFIYLFGESTYSLRMVQAIFGVFNIVLVFLISRNIFKNSEYKYLIPLIATALYALNPLVIQSSIVTDIDGGVLNFFVLLFIYFFISKKNYFYLVPVLALIMWTKFSAPIVLFGVIMIFSLMQRKYKTMGKNFLLFIFAGISFIVTFFIYSHLQDLNFLDPFSNIFSSERVFSNKFSLLPILRSAWSFKTFFYFVNPFLIFLFFIATAKFYSSTFVKLKEKRMNDSENSLLFIWLFALMTILFYAYLGANAWGFPKYYISAIAPICIFVSPIIMNLISKIRKIKKKLMLLYIFLTILILFSVKDPLIPEFDQTISNSNIFFALTKVLVSLEFYIIIPFVFTFLFVSWALKKRITMALLLLLIFFYLYINVVQALTGYSSYYRYGDTGVLETVRFFKDNNISANRIASYPNIGYYLGMTEYYEITFVYKSHKVFKEKVIDNPKIDYIAIYERDINRIGEKNMKSFELVQRLGSYFIYKKNDL